MSETVVFDFVNHRVVLESQDGTEREAPANLTLVVTGPAQPDDE